MAIKREQLIPTTYTMKIEQHNTEIYLYGEDNNKAMAFSGRKGKWDFNYRFTDTAARDAHVAKYLKEAKKAIDEKEARKLKAEEDFKLVEVGDVFKSVWGYDQTNIDYFQLISLKGKTGVFREISYIVVKDYQDSDSQTRRPALNEFVGAEFKARINGTRFKINSYSGASRMEDKKQASLCNWGR